MLYYIIYPVVYKVFRIGSILTNMDYMLLHVFVSDKNNNIIFYSNITL